MESELAKRLCALCALARGKDPSSQSGRSRMNRSENVTAFSLFQGHPIVPRVVGEILVLDDGEVLRTEPMERVVKTHCSLGLTW